MSLDLKGPAGLSEPVTGKAELIDYLRRAEKPRGEWKVGVEHEKIGVVDGNFEAVPYYGETGIRSILDALVDHPRVLAVLDRLLRPNYLLSQLQVINILPGEKRQLPHAHRGLWVADHLHHRRSELDFGRFRTARDR